MKILNSSDFVDLHFGCSVATANTNHTEPGAYSIMQDYSGHSTLAQNLHLNLKMKSVSLKWQNRHMHVFTNNIHECLYIIDSSRVDDRFGSFNRIVNLTAER